MKGLAADHGNARSAAGTAACSAVIALALLADSGCQCTLGPARWAAERVPQSRAVGLEARDDGSARLLVNMRGARDRSDGLYALEIPAGWRELARTASAWGSDIQSIAQAPAKIAPAEATSTGTAAGLEALTLDAIIGGRRSSRGSVYGVAILPHPLGYSLEVFGYDPAPIGAERARAIVTMNTRKPDAPKRNIFISEEGRAEAYAKYMSDKTDAEWGRTIVGLVTARAKLGQWVHLGGVRIDAGKVQPGRVPCAVLAYVMMGPFLMIGDLVSLEVGAFQTYETGERRKSIPPIGVPPLVRKLASEDTSSRCKAARDLRDCGVAGRAAVPALRELALDADSDLRSQALGTLEAMHAIDGGTLARMLESRDVAVRCDAAYYLGRSDAPDSQSLLDIAAKDADPQVRAQAARAAAARANGAGGEREAQ